LTWRWSERGLVARNFPASAWAPVTPR
jgi:hypothetical protein